MAWGSEYRTAIAIVFALYFLSMIIIGWGGRHQAREIRKLSGTLATDFVFEQGFKGTLFNMGLVGLMGMAYIFPMPRTSA